MEKGYLYFLFFTLINSQYLIAQSEWSLKLYQNTDVRYIAKDYYLTNQGATYQSKYEVDFSRLSLSLHLNPKNEWKHEFDVSFSNHVIPLSHIIDKTDKHESSSRFYSAQYELLRNLFNTNKKLNFLLGGSVLSYWTRLNHTSSVREYFSTYQQYMGSTLNLMPHAVFKPSDRLTIVRRVFC